MKRGGLPIWLLRDGPGLLGVMLSFWPLMILVITNGFAAMRGLKVSRSVFEKIPIFFAHAEARLDFAIRREAYRRLGRNPRLVSFTAFAPPADWAETASRAEAYRCANMNLEACARAYVEDLRQQHGISAREAGSATDGLAARVASNSVTGRDPIPVRAASGPGARPPFNQKVIGVAKPDLLAARRDPRGFVLVGRLRRFLCDRAFRTGR
jgi:hypothetical protein